jgi:hypothetical protein
MSVDPIDVVVSTRIQDVLRWSFEKNECVFTLTHDDGARQWHAHLPPLASPVALYDSVVIDTNACRVVRWNGFALDETWGRTLNRLENMSSAELNVVRHALKLDARADIPSIFAKARVTDIQVVDALGPARCIFDGAALNDAQVKRLNENFACFGRRAKRNMKPACMLLFPKHQDSCCLEHDFSRSENALLKDKAHVSAAWHACRRARTAGMRVTLDLVKREYGDDVARTFEDSGFFELDVAASSPVVPSDVRADAFQRIKFISVSDAHKRSAMFPPGHESASTATYWFAPCSALAESTVSRIGWAVHDTEGAVFIASLDVDGARTHDGRTVTPSTLRFSSQICAAEGGFKLFEPRSLKRIGLFCALRDTRVWPASLISSVLRLAQEDGGMVFVNADDASELKPSL